MIIDKVPYKFEVHSAVKLKNTPWMYCKYCGLLYLNNVITKWCIRMGCNGSDHKDYKQMLYKSSK